MGGVLAIDLGERKSGFATADPLRVALEPLDGLRANEGSAELLDHVARLLEERSVSTLLVGVPVHPDTRRSLASREFVARLVRRFPGLEVCTHDERLTTKEAEARLAW